MKSCRPYRQALLAVVCLALIASSCKKNQDNPVEPPAGSSGGTIATGPAVDAGSMMIGPSGGTFTVAKPGTPVDGLQIRVPTRSYGEARTFQVSYAAVQGHQFGSDITILSPLITIANGGGYADSIMALRIPVRVPAGRFAMGFFYNDETGAVEGLPLLGRDSSSITIGTRHFAFSSLTPASGFPKLFSRGLSGLSAPPVRAGVVIVSIDELLLAGNQDTGFRPGVDDWGFTNWGSHIAPGGHCAGQSIGALWYYTEKRLKGSPPLWRRFDNDGNLPKTPDLWEDDVLGYKFCSVLQENRGRTTLADVLGGFFQSIPLVSDIETYNLFTLSMRVSHKPQYVVIAEGIFTGSAHAMIIYGQAGGQLFVCDPNYPGDQQRRIVKNTVFFDPYYSGANAGSLGTAYKHIYYAGIGSLIDWNTIESSWKEVANKTIGNDMFPTYSIVVLDEHVEFVPLTDGFKKADGDFTLSVRGNGFLGRFQAYDSTGKSLALDGAFHLRKGNHRIGIAIYDRDGKWVGFKWTRLESEAEGLLLPLTLDNTWKYDMKGYNEQGGLVAFHNRQSTVIGYRTVAGERYSELEERIDSDQPASSLCLNHFDGLWVINASGTPELAYKYPAHVGDAYPLSTGVSIRVDSVSVTHAVPAGTFDNCYVYTIGYGTIPHTTVKIFAVDIGEIETREYDKGSNGSMYLSSISQLVSYTLK